MSDAAQPKDTILSAHGVTKRFRGFTALDDVTLNISEGTIHALIGPNGAGKTTCFNILTKFLEPTSGRIIYRGADISRKSPAQVACLGLVRSFQISAVFLGLSVLENVRVALQRRHGNSFNFWRSDRTLASLDDAALRLIEDVGLSAFADTPAGELSYGRKRALEIATTLALDPVVLLLDEPTAGMSRQDVERVTALIRRVARNRTVVMVEHNLSVVSSLSDRITVLARGRILAEGDYATVSKAPEVIEAYTGAAHA